MLSQLAAAWSVVLKDAFIMQVDFLIQMLYLCLSVFLVFFLIDSEQKTRDQTTWVQRTLRALYRTHLSGGDIAEFPLENLQDLYI